MNREMTLQVSNLRIDKGQRSLVDDVSFVLPKGRILAILGSNGAGKSSLLKGILGLSPLTRGTVTVEGRNVARLAAVERARTMAYVPQQSVLDAEMAVADIVRMGRFAHDGSGASKARHDDAAVESALTRCDAIHLLHRRFGSLSGGERGRVLLARALATDAPLLLLDEPTHALDVAQTLMCLALLRSLADSGSTVVMVTHDLNQILSTADQLLLMKQGRMVAFGPPRALLCDELAEEVFGVKLLPRAAYGYARQVPQQESSLA